MLRIHFATADLGRVRVLATLSPYVETLLALEQVGRADNVVFRAWGQRVRGRLCNRMSEIAVLAGCGRPIAELLPLLKNEPVRWPADTGLSAEQAARALHEFHRYGVAPYWRGIRGYLERERGARARVVVTGGVERLLTTLHPKIRWAAPVLELPGEPDRDIHLDGKGLLLTPSMFLANRAGLFLDEADGAGCAALVYPALPSVSFVATLLGSVDPNSQALASLLGRNRAAVLEALTDSMGTGELAQSLGISAAAISQHTSVLRAAGLITTRRHRNTVAHSVTALGMALLEGEGAVPQASIAGEDRCFPQDLKTWRARVRSGDPVGHTERR